MCKLSFALFLWFLFCTSRATVISCQGRTNVAESVYRGVSVTTPTHFWYIDYRNEIIAVNILNGTSLVYSHLLPEVTDYFYSAAYSTTLDLVAVVQPTEIAFYRVEGGSIRKNGTVAISMLDRASVVTKQNSFFVWGGLDEPYNFIPARKLLRVTYNATIITLTTLTLSLPTGLRNRHSHQAIYHSSANKMVIYGGITGSFSSIALADCWELDLSTYQWARCIAQGSPGAHYIFTWTPVSPSKFLLYSGIGGGQAWLYNYTHWSRLPSSNCSLPNLKGHFAHYNNQTLIISHGKFSSGSSSNSLFSHKFRLPVENSQNFLPPPPPPSGGPISPNSETLYTPFFLNVTQGNASMSGVLDLASDDNTTVQLTTSASGKLVVNLLFEAPESTDSNWKIALFYSSNFVVQLASAGKSLGTIPATSGMVFTEILVSEPIGNFVDVSDLNATKIDVEVSAGPDAPPHSTAELDTMVIQLCPECRQTESVLSGPNRAMNLYIIIAASGAGVVLISVAIVVTVALINKKPWRPHYRLDTDRIISSQIFASLVPVPDVVVKKRLWDRKGPFGNVYECVAFESSTKVLGIFIPNDEKFCEELAPLTMLAHPNVSKVFGAFIYQGDYLLITEYYESSLLQFLKTASPKELGREILLEISSGIVKGMCFLNSKNIVHKSLCANHVFLNEYRQPKITNLGMTTHDNINPRWAAPEVLTDGNFSEKSDVWSFGVTLFEIFSHGAQPYGPIGDQVVAMAVKQNSKTLEKTSIISPNTWEWITSCTTRDPASRPTFAKIAETMEISSSTLKPDQESNEPVISFYANV